MTILGKILVILNLVFTLIVGALMVLVYAARTNWQAAYNKKDEQYKAVVAARDINAEELRKSQDAAKSFEADVAKRLDDEAKQRKEVEAKLDAALALSRKGNEVVADRDREVRAAQGQVAQIQKEKGVLEEAIKARDELHQTLLKQYNEANQLATGSKQQSDTYRLRVAELLARIEELEKRKGTSTAVAEGNRPAPNPPPGNVEGLITKVDDKGEFMTISVGTDSGVQKGHTLDAYRMLGEKAQYLGTIRVLDAKAKEAVARPEKIYSQLKPGDSVGVITHGG